MAVTYVGDIVLSSSTLSNVAIAMSHWLLMLHLDLMQAYLRPHMSLNRLFPSNAAGRRRGGGGMQLSKRRNPSNI